MCLMAAMVGFRSDHPIVLFDQLHHVSVPGMLSFGVGPGVGRPVPDLPLANGGDGSPLTAAQSRAMAPLADSRREGAGHRLPSSAVPSCDRNGLTSIGQGKDHVA